jgi:hypothetical protein
LNAVNGRLELKEEKEGRFEARVRCLELEEKLKNSIALEPNDLRLLPGWYRIAVVVLAGQVSRNLCEFLAVSTPFDERLNFFVRFVEAPV